MASRSVHKLLDLLLDRRVKAVVPKLDHCYGVSYHESLGVAREEFPDLNDALSELEKRGALKSVKVGTYLACPECGSHRLIPKFFCPVCGSQDVKWVEAIHHIPCGFIAPLEAFSAGGLLKCPKCGKPLKAIGVDYNRYHRVIFCENCKNVSIFPKLVFICFDCGKSASERELDIKPLLRYDVIEERLLRLPFERAVSEKLEEMGVKVEHPRWVIGRSGLVHRFSFSVKKDSTEHLIDVIEEKNGVNEDKVLAMFGKLFDSAAKSGILIAVPRATQNAKSLAERLNIKVVEASDLNEILEKLHKLIIEPKETTIDQYTKKG